LIGQVVRRAEELGVSLKALELAEYQAIHPAFGGDVYEALNFQRSVAARDAQGGTAPVAVRAQIERARMLLVAD
jgi:argininosuccinate lyase